MTKILAILCFFIPAIASAHMQRVIIQEPNGIALHAKLFLPNGAVTAPAIVALHGCAGPIKRRDDDWAERLADQGHAVLLPSSFISHGLKTDCRTADHGATPYGYRRDDALAAAYWLAGQKFAPPGGLLLLGWSDGGTTLLATIDNAPKGLFRGAVAFYPACYGSSKRADWHPAAPILILMGADDDWTPPARCQALVAKFPQQMKLVLYPHAYHDFDMPDDPPHEITNLPYTKLHNHVAHVGENPAARAAALQAVPAFFASLPSP